MATRVTQVAVESLEQSTALKARVTQVAVEVLEGSTSAKARVSQVAVEVLLIPATQVNSDLAIDAIVRSTEGRNLAIDARIGDVPVDTSTADSAAVPHAEVYGSPVYDEVLIHPEVYGERPLIDEAVPVNKDLVPDYTILDLATKDLVVDYVIDNVVASQAGAELELDYAIGAAGGAHKDLAFHYRVTKATKRQQRGANLQFKYLIQQRVPRGKNLAFKYKILEPVHVGKNLAFKYKVNVNTKAGASLGFSYAVQKNTVVGKDLGFTYEVAHTPPTSVAGKDLGFSFEVSINNLTGSDYGFDYDVSINNLVGSDLDFEYQEDAGIPVGLDLDLDWDVQQKSEIGSELDIDAEVNVSTPHADLDFGYEVEQQTPFVDLEFDAPLSGTVESELDIDYQLGSASSGRDRGDGPRYVVVETKKIPPRVEQVGADLAFSYQILSHVDTELFIDAAVRQLSRLELGIDHQVRVTTGSGRTFDAPIVDFYDTNRGVLLSEVDEDLALIA